MKNIEEYENYAIQMANEPEKLNQIKSKLLLQKKNTNTFNAKIYTDNGRYEGGNTLSNRNDSGYSFNEIADIIEKQF